MPNSKAQIANRQAILDRNEPVFQQMLEYRKANPTEIIQFELAYPGHAQTVRSRMKELGLKNVIFATSETGYEVFSDPIVTQMWSKVE
jgi:hypothetical protein